MRSQGSTELQNISFSQLVTRHKSFIIGWVPMREYDFNYLYIEMRSTFLPMKIIQTFQLRQIK